jgi:uncharacterized protein YciU (UPF0263 family)
MKYRVRVTDGHCFRDIEVQTDKGVEEACSLAMDRATEIERSGDVCYREAFENSGQAEYVDSVSIADDRLDVPVEYRFWTERKLLQEIAELNAEINRLRGGVAERAARLPPTSRAVVT